MKELNEMQHAVGMQGPLAAADYLHQHLLSKE